MSPDPLTDVDGLARAARRVDTACGDGSLSWRLWGPPDGPPLLLLHGGSGSWTHWVRNIAPLVGAGWLVIAPDMPGFGDSAPPPDGHDADVLPRWLERGLQALIGASPLPVVGFSYGGLVAGIWAAEVPDRIAHLVLVGVPSLSNEQLAPLDLQPWHAVPEGPQRNAMHRHNLMQLMLAHETSADDLAVRLQADNVARDRLRRRRLMREDVLARLLPTLHCPVDGLWGELDALYAGRHALVERVLATATGFGTLTWIPDGGHWVQFERPAAFNRALADALAARLRNDPPYPAI